MFANVLQMFYFTCNTVLNMSSHFFLDWCFCLSHFNEIVCFFVYFLLFFYRNEWTIAFEKACRNSAVFCFDIFCFICRYLRNQCTDIGLQITSTSIITNNNNNSNSITGGSASFRAHRTVVTCYSSWLSDQILNNGHWCVGDVVYLDEVCRTSKMTAATFHALLDFMYTGRTNLSVD